MARSLRHLLIGAAALALLLLGQGTAFANGSGSIVQVQAGGGGGEAEGPIEILIVQGYVKSIDEENLTLTAPGAPADLPLRLAPDTRFIQEEQDISRTDLKEGALVRAALVPMGEEFLAVVVELVPEEPSQAPAPGSPEQPQEPTPENPEQPQAPTQESPTSL